MSIINSPLLGNISKSIGHTTFFDYGDKIVIRKKVSRDKNRNKKSKRQIVQQKKFKYTSEFKFLFEPALAYAYPNLSKTGLHNMFIKINKDAVNADPDTFITEIDMGKFLCSDGDMLPPDFTIKVEEEKSVFTFEYFKQKLSPFSQDDDDIYVMFLNPEVDLWENQTFHLGKRGQPHSQTLYLKNNVHYIMAYTFAVSANRKYRSPSVFTQLQLDKDYTDLDNYPENYEVIDGGRLVRILPSKGDLKILQKITGTKKNNPRKKK